MPPFFSTILIPMILAAFERLAQIIEAAPADAAAAVRTAAAAISDPANIHAFSEGFKSGFGGPSPDGLSTESAEPGTVPALDLGLGTPPPAAPQTTGPFNAYAATDIDIDAKIARAVADAIGRHTAAASTAAGVVQAPAAARPSRPPPPRPPGSNA